MNSSTDSLSVVGRYTVYTGYQRRRNESMKVRSSKKVSDSGAGSGRDQNRILTSK